MSSLGRDQMGKKYLKYKDYVVMMFMFFKGGGIVDRVTRYVMPTEDRALAIVKPLTVREMKMALTEAWIPPVDVEPVRWDVAKKRKDSRIVYLKMLVIRH